MTFSEIPKTGFLASMPICIGVKTYAIAGHYTYLVN